MAGKSWIPGVALALIGCMLLPFVWDVPIAGFLTAGLVVVGLGSALVCAGRNRAADVDEFDEPLSIAEKRKHMELEESEPEPEGRMVRCRNCGEEFEARLGVCPTCRCFSSG